MLALGLSLLALSWGLWLTYMLRYPARWAEKIDAIHSHLAHYNLSSKRMKQAEKGIALNAIVGVTVVLMLGCLAITLRYGNRFLFTGREYLAEVNIYDYRKRVYSADLGRFLQTDPLRFSAGDVNIYRYCGNNPLNRTDAMGLCADGGWKGGQCGVAGVEYLHSGWTDLSGELLPLALGRAAPAIACRLPSGT